MARAMSLDLDDCLADARIVPVVAVSASADASALAAPLAQAGITAVEVTLRTSGSD
jgi:2-keto-3-deoxy-6-phosphogluconate aldolase